MKYMLIIWVCSFIEGNRCMEPVKYTQLYDSWYECSVAAHKESTRILQKMGYKWTNQYQVGTKYTCKITETL
jgi:hypothetical protein